MFAQVTRLQYWKSEHDEQTCEDAFGDNITDGLFVVADGAGTTLFSNIWAKILVQSYLAIPLMSNYPFEVEWWVRRVQEQFKREAPDPGKMAWNALQKAQNQGSHSTLATLRVFNSTADHAQAELLAFGDSCILISNPNSEHLQTFPLDSPADFERSPICVPSKLSIFNRYFHRCHSTRVELASGDVVVLATDAVAKWVISAGSNRYAHARAAFQEIIAQTSDTWAAFVTECRNRGEMIDDDSTALIVTLGADAFANATPLGVTNEHSKSIRESRKNEFNSAIRINNKELIAITYGDGVDLDLEGITIPQEQIEQARNVADALREVLQVLRQEVNGPDAAAKLKPLWQRYAPLLLEEPCAVNLRQTLERIGIPILPSTQPQAPSTVERHLTEAEIANLQHEREQLNLERGFFHALRAEDDKTIMAFYNTIQQSPYAQNIKFSPQEQQRIGLAYQRETERQRIQAASKEQMAQQAVPDQVVNAATIPVTEHNPRYNQAFNGRRPSWFARFIRWWRKQNA